VSHHPDKSGLNRFDSFFRTYEQDRDLYGRDADFIININLEREIRTSSAARNYIRGEKYWGPFGNCTDAVAELLAIGGIDLPLGLYYLEPISFPLKLKELLRDRDDTTIVRDVNPTVSP
ncbi:MAG: hypothetical protein OIF35_05885, partial [Cellvibrionaceae bacterium]|nr:hypothetical protein [Cellvibrionaceae bacterium]